MEKWDILSRYRALRVRGYSLDEAAEEMGYKKSYITRLEHSHRKSGGKYCKICDLPTLRAYCSFTCYMASGLDPGPWLLAKARYLTKVKIRRYN